MSDQEAQYLELCKSRIEDKLQWGPVAQWHNEEFEDLSKGILEKSDVSLSHTTLKRLWGRVKYEHLPTTTTLNALAIFLGYENWRGFRQFNVSKIRVSKTPRLKMKELFASFVIVSCQLAF